MKKFKEHIKSAAAYDKKVKEFIDSLIADLRPYSDEVELEIDGKYGIEYNNLHFNPPLRDVLKIVNIVCERPGASEFASGRYRLEKALETPLKPVTYKGQRYNLKYHGAHIFANIFKREDSPDGIYVYCRMKVTLYYRHPNTALQDTEVVFYAMFRIE